MQESLSSAAEAYNQGRHADAKALCQRALSQDQKNHVALNLLGAIELALGNPAAARTTFKRAIRIDPSNASYAANLAIANGASADSLLLAGDRRAALELYAEALTGPGLNAKRRDQIGQIILDTKMIAQIIDPIRRLVGRGKFTVPDEWVDRIRTQVTTAIQTLAVVFFHVDLDGGHPFAALTGKDGAMDYASALESAIAAARSSNSAATVVILTDARSDVSRFEDCVIVRLPINTAQLMYSRMLSYAALSVSAVCSGPMLFLDTDVCLVRDMSPLFDGSFDIALTYRVKAALAHMPFNEGVIGASSSAAASEFFSRCLAAYEALSAMPSVRERYGFDAKHWRGGQLSLAAFTGWKCPPALAETETIHGLRVRSLPCDEFNYRVVDNTVPADIATKWALHFKGNSKHLTAKYLDALRAQGVLR